MQGQSPVDAVCVVGDVDPWTHLILTVAWVGQGLGGQAHALPHRPGTTLICSSCGSGNVCRVCSTCRHRPAADRKRAVSGERRARISKGSDRVQNVPLGMGQGVTCGSAGLKAPRGAEAVSRQMPRWKHHLQREERTQNRLANQATHPPTLSRQVLSGALCAPPQFLPLLLPLLLPRHSPVSYLCSSPGLH